MAKLLIYKSFFLSGQPPTEAKGEDLCPLSVQPFLYMKHTAGLQCGQLIPIKWKVCLH